MTYFGENIKKLHGINAGGALGWFISFMCCVQKLHYLNVERYDGMWWCMWCMQCSIIQICSSDR